MLDHCFASSLCVLRFPYAYMFCSVVIFYWVKSYMQICLTNHRWFLCSVRNYNSLGILFARWDELMSFCMYAVSLLYNYNCLIFNPAVFVYYFIIVISVETISMTGVIWVQYLAQEHFNIWTGGAGNQTINLQISGRPALPPESQLPH